MGMEVYHKQYGSGKVKVITEKSVDVEFSQERVSMDPVASELTPLEANASLEGLNMPLDQLINQVGR